MRCGEKYVQVSLEFCNLGDIAVTSCLSDSCVIDISLKEDNANK